MGRFLVARTNLTSLGINTIGKNDADIEAQVFRHQPITEIERDAIENPVNGMKVYNSDTNLIDGYIDGAWPVPSGESVVIAHEDAWIQTRTQGSFVHTGGGTDGTVLSPLDITITPAKAGNKAIIDFIIFGESTEESNAGFVITRNGVLMDGTTDGSNNDYAVNAVTTSDGNTTSTPQVVPVRLIDDNTLNVSSTYRLLYRVTDNGQTNTYKLNRSINAPAQGVETGVSTAKIIEYVT